MLQKCLNEPHFAAHVCRSRKVMSGAGEIVGHRKFPEPVQRLFDVMGLTSPMPSCVIFTLNEQYWAAEFFDGNSRSRRHAPAVGEPTAFCIIKRVGGVSAAIRMPLKIWIGVLRSFGLTVTNACPTARLRPIWIKRWIKELTWRVGNQCIRQALTAVETANDQCQFGAHRKSQKPRPFRH